MKIFIRYLPFWVTYFVLVIVSCIFIKLAHGCEQGCEEHAGVCACMGEPEIAPSVAPSDEKPHHSQIREWEDGGVVASTQASLAADDAKQDREKAEADHAGKKLAGIQ